MSMSMSMSMLLEELITEILSRLPAKSLLRFQCVSKTWLALIKDPNFINMHLQNNRERTLIVQTSQTSQTWKNRIVLDLNYYLVNVSNENEDQPVKVFPSFFDHEIFSFPIIVDCCNGLVCVSTFYGEAVIWNPSIRKYKKLPLDPTVYDPRLLSNFPFPNDNFAFGYDPINNDYKFLRVVEHFESYRSVTDPDGFAGAFEVKVCSLKAQSWRTVEAQWPYKESRIWSEPVYLNGALRWLIKTATRGMRLLAFHLYTEKFQEQTLTGLPVEPHTLEVLGGSLLCVSAYRREAQAIDFWMMKETSWSQLCTVPLPGIQCRRLVRAVFSTDGQKMLLIMQMDFEKNLFSYDIKKKTLSNFLTHIPEKIWTQISQESLLLLDGDSRDTSVD